MPLFSDPDGLSLHHLSFLHPSKNDLSDLYRFFHLFSHVTYNFSLFWLWLRASVVAQWDLTLNTPPFPNNSVTCSVLSSLSLCVIICKIRNSSIYVSRCLWALKKKIPGHIDFLASDLQLLRECTYLPTYFVMANDERIQIWDPKLWYLEEAAEESCEVSLVCILEERYKD